MDGKDWLCIDHGNFVSVAQWYVCGNVLRRKNNVKDGHTARAKHEPVSGRQEHAEEEGDTRRELILQERSMQEHWH